MELSEIFALLAAIGLVGLFLRSKQVNREARQARIDAMNAEANEIHRQAEELKNGKLKKDKEEYENAKNKLVVLAVHDGDKPDGES